MRKRLVKVLRGEVSIWTGYNGHGKSLVLLLVTLVAMTQGERVCIASFEIHPRKTLFRMVRQALGKELPEHNEITATLDWLVGKLWIFDRLGTSSPARILEVFRYAYRRYGVQQFVIDSLMKCGIGSDDYHTRCWGGTAGVNPEDFITAVQFSEELDTSEIAVAIS